MLARILLLALSTNLCGCTMPNAVPPPARVATFLMFQDGRAEEAMRFYVGLVPDSRVLDVTRHGPDTPGPEGSLQLATCEIGGHRVAFSDSFVRHDFDFTPSTSLFVACADDPEIERLAADLATGGEALMPLGDYGFSRRFAWVVDRYGVSWQLNLP